MQSIIKLFNDSGFDPETIKAMDDTYVRLIQWSQPSEYAKIAKAILAAAEAGERCVDGLSERAVSELRRAGFYPPND